MLLLSNTRARDAKRFSWLKKRSSKRDGPKDHPCARNARECSKTRLRAYLGYDPVDLQFEVEVLNQLASTVEAECSVELDGI